MHRMESTARLTTRSRSIEDLVSEFRRGQITVPDLQRPLRWTSRDVARLFDSVFKGYPIGTVLLWRRSEGGPMFVVDGQQRLTSFARALHDDPAEDPRFHIVFDPATRAFSAGGGPATASRIPLAVAFDLAGALDFAAEHHLSGENRDALFTLAKRLHEYDVPTYEVESSDEAAVADIFDRMNTYGRRLSRADVFDALHGRDGDDGRVNLGRVTATGEELGFGTLAPQQAMYAVLAMDGPDVQREFRSTYREDGAATAAVEHARAAYGRAIAFLRDDAEVPHLRLVAYQHILLGLIRLFHHHPEVDDRSRVLLRRFVWRASVLGPHLRGGTTGTLSQTVRAIDPDDLQVSVRQLLELFPATARRPRGRWTDRVSITTAETRTALAALFSLHPLVEPGGERVDPAVLLEDSGSSALAVLWRAAPETLRHTMANRLLLSDDEAGAGMLLTTATDGEQRTTYFASHLLDPALRTALDDPEVPPERVAALMAARRDAQERFVDAFVDARAEWSASDRPSLQSVASEE